jgi:hypothetical protein
MRSHLLAVLAALVVGLSGCQRPPVEEPVEEPVEPAVSCDPVEHPPIQGGEHLIGDQDPPVPYSSTPPTSGWHASGAFEIAVHGPDDPLPEPKQVSVLEAGAVVVTYHDLSGEEVVALETLAAERFPGRVSVTPYDKLEPGSVALTGWGVLQHCTGLDLDVVAGFIDEYADEQPATPGH